MKKSAALFLLALVLPFTAYASPTAPQPVACSPEKTGNPCQNVAKKPSLNLGAGNPIHLITGNKYQQETDLPMRASGLELVRYYNSLGTNKTLLGEGWSHSYETRLWFAGGKPQIVHADGSRTLFQPRQGDTALAQESNHGKLIYQNQDHTWTWQLKPGLEKTFNAKGRLITIKLPGLATLHITRDETPGPTQGAILEVHGGKQEKLVFHYETINDTARLSRIETPAGLFLYRHDQPKGHQAQRLTGMLRPDNMGKTYFHEPEHQHGNPFLLTGISIHDNSGKNALRTNSWAYNDKGQAIRSIQGSQTDTQLRLDFEYLATPGTENAKGLTRITDAEGNITDMHTSIKGGRFVLEEVKGAGCYGCAAPGTKASYDSEGSMTVFNGKQIHYDAQGNIKQLDIKHSPWTGLTLQYDTKDRPIAWSSTITGTEHTRYNEHGQIIEQTFANGNRTLLEYDETGNLKSITETSKRKEPPIITKLGGTADFGWIFIKSPKESLTFDSRQENTLYVESYRNRNEHSDVTAVLTDQYTFEKSNRALIHHLPEGGYITYLHDKNNKPETIIWTEQSGKKHHLILDSSIPEKGYVLGNQLAFHALKTDAGQTQLSLWNKDKRFWTQTLDFSPDNTLRSETFIVPDAKYEAGRSYAYDPSQRMVSSKTSAQYKEQDLSGLHHYAWNDNGSNAAYFNGSENIISNIERDTSGLPLKIDDFILEYGANQRLKYVELNKELLAEYIYNGLGQRIIKKTKNAHTHYYYANNQLVGEWTTHMGKRTKQGLNGGIDRRYIYAGQLPVAFIEYEHASFSIDDILNESFMANDSTTLQSIKRPQLRAYKAKLYFIHADHIGQPFMVTDEHRNIRWLAQNSPNGESNILQADIEFNLRLPGQYYDKETGWHYNLHRYYDPAAGHYLEPDPLGPTTQNAPFGYAAQQPRLFTDPLGLILFAFDGTNNNAPVHSNVIKFMRLYSMYYRDTPYIEGSGALPYFDTMTTTLDLLAATKTHFIVQMQLSRLKKIIYNDYFSNLAESITKKKPIKLPVITIDIVGFSRGATFALIFANEIAEQLNDGLFSHTFHDPKQLNKLITMQACLDLRFIGLFDNVAQLGNRGSMNKSVKYDVPEEWTWVAHAVALHEFRSLFPVTTLTGKSNNFIEQGFIGAHSDIGGIIWDSDPKDPNNPKNTTKNNLPESEKYSDLGDIALAWMHWQATKAGVPLKPLDYFKDYEYTPENYASIDNPYMHGKPDNGETTPNRDRFIHTAGSNENNLQQADHPTLGRKAREAVEPFIRRIPKHEKTREFFGPSHRIVGEVDVPAYKRWLEEKLNWDAPF